MQFAEFKTKDNKLVYWSNQLGEIEIKSPERLDIDTIDGIFMRVKQEGRKVKDLIVDLKKDDGKTLELKVNYKPVNPWNTDKHTKVKQKDNIIKKIIKKIKALFSKMKS